MSSDKGKSASQSMSKSNNESDSAATSIATVQQLQQATPGAA